MIVNEKTGSFSNFTEQQLEQQEQDADDKLEEGGGKVREGDKKKKPWNEEEMLILLNYIKIYYEMFKVNRSLFCRKIHKEKVIKARSIAAIQRKIQIVLKKYDDKEYNWKWYKYAEEIFDQKTIGNDEVEMVGVQVVLDVDNQKSVQEPEERDKISIQNIKNNNKRQYFDSNNDPALISNKSKSKKNNLPAKIIAKAIRELAISKERIWREKLRLESERSDKIYEIQKRKNEVVKLKLDFEIEQFQLANNIKFKELELQQMHLQQKHHR
ncbi:14416_t:CDS:2 [Entrophospora sp. SA101]|nr:14416_t:CDS:2 [Entrophospora sp. SA101]